MSVDTLIVPSYATRVETLADVFGTLELQGLKALFMH